MKKQIKQQNKEWICQKWPQNYLIHTTTRSSRGLKTVNGKIVVANYTTSNQTLKSGKIPTTVLGNMSTLHIIRTRLTHEHLMTRND